MRNKTIRFLAISFTLIMVLYVGIFYFLIYSMNKKSADTINQVGSVYMSGASERVSQHFNTLVESQFNYVKAAIDYTPPETVTDIDVMKERLAYSANIRGFEYLAFLAEDGRMEMLYGDQMQILDEESFVDKLSRGQDAITIGEGQNEEGVLLLGVAVCYPMNEGEESTALVAGVSLENIKSVLALDEEGDIVYSHVIRKDGDFVIRSGDAVRKNYFDRIYAVFEELNGKNAEEYVAELKEAMEKKEDYSAVFQIGNERRHLYCTSLSYSDWYLVTVMPYGAIDQEVSDLGDWWLITAVICCGVVIIALLVIIIQYGKMTKRQIESLTEAQKTAEEARRAAEEANNSKSEFLSNMSHDIRTPMNAIVGMTAIATANIDNIDQVKSCLRKITLSGRHLLGLINDVLDMSKIESGKMTLNMDQISLREITENIVNIMQPQMKAKRQNFDVSIVDITTENVYCDGVRLNQILLNLLSNAVKFTPEGGNIQMRLYEEDSQKGKDFIQIHIKVKDNGIGMSEEFQEHIFTSFSREDRARVQKTEGTGLGMAITKYIVDAMGGTIHVKSKQNEGTEFHVVLDLEKANVEKEEMSLPTWNMLLVDDDQELCVGTVESLQSLGLRAEWVLNGEDAIRIIDERHAQQDDYQVILLDWKLPDTNGVELARKIRQKMGEDVPILLISAYDWSEIEEEARAAGVNGFIAKPLFKSTLFFSLKPYAGLALDKKEEKKENSIDLNGKKILLAEDNELNWEVAEALLEDLGLELEWAENGQICVDKFKQAEVGHYDAILMDIRMPVMNGYEATEAIRGLDREDSNIPIIAMTADAFSEDIEKCLKHGMNAHVAKPIDIEEVSRMLKRYMS